MTPAEAMRTAAMDAIQDLRAKTASTFTPDCSGAMGEAKCNILYDAHQAVKAPPIPSAAAFVTDGMIQAACAAGYGVDTDKGSNLYNVMKRALAAGIAAR